MNKNVKVRITGDGVREFFDRAREHARKLDRGEELATEITVSFENASDMMRVLSAAYPTSACCEKKSDSYV